MKALKWTLILRPNAHTHTTSTCVILRPQTRTRIHKHTHTHTFRSIWVNKKTVMSRGANGWRRVKWMSNLCVYSAPVWGPGPRGGPLGREKTLSLADFASHTQRAGLCSDVCVPGPRFRRRSESRSKHLGRDSKVFRAAGRLHTSTLPPLEAPLKHQTAAFFWHSVIEWQADFRTPALFFMRVWQEKKRLREKQTGNTHFRCGALCLEATSPQPPLKPSWVAPSPPGPFPTGPLHRSPISRTQAAVSRQEEGHALFFFCLTPWRKPEREAINYGMVRLTAANQCKKRPGSYWANTLQIHK